MLKGVRCHVKAYNGVWMGGRAPSGGPGRSPGVGQGSEARPEADEVLCLKHYYFSMHLP